MYGHLNVKIESLPLQVFKASTATTLHLPLPSTYNNAKPQNSNPWSYTLNTGCGNPKDKNIQLTFSEYFNFCASLAY